MIKIKLYELDKHRNECTFRPFLYAKESFKQIGIEFVIDGKADFAFVAQASFINKKVSLDESVQFGLDFLKTTVKEPYFLIDGQDSTSLIGSYEVFKQSNALLLLKCSLLKDRSLYNKGLNLGRYYWGSGDYKIECSNKIVLSGTNWLMTHWCGLNVQWQNIDKQYDISAMFQYPSKTTLYEHGYNQSIHYDNHRKPVIDILNQLPYNITKLNNGERVDINEYYRRLASSKIIIAPFGYGEMAPRDLEAAMFGCILIKPDMSYIDTIPNAFDDGITYIACKHDYSDLQEKIDLILNNYEYYKNTIIDNARKRFIKIMNPDNLVIHIYDIFKNLDGVEHE